MGKWKTPLSILLSLVLVAAFCLSAYASNVEPKPDELAAKLQELKAQMPAYSPDLKSNPKQAYQMIPARTPVGEILWEGFEGGAVPPTGWTAVINNPFTWEIDSYNPYEGAYNASCFYDENYTGTQDEWLVSPVIDLSQKSNWKLDFWWMGSYYWSVDPYDNCNLEVWISTDGGANFTTMLWSEDGVGEFSNWTWYKATIDLAAYSAESNVKIGFRYYGYDGAQFSIDAISINDEALPVGRCCYGDPSAPDCVDTTEAACGDLGGSWDANLDCTNNPCPIAPSNDDCVNAELIPGPFPATATGSTEGATIDCPGVLDWNAVWYKFEAPNAYNNITIDFCTSPYDVECIGVVLYANCDDCSNYILNTDIQWNDCGGTNKPLITWEDLPGPATYYYPVFIGDANCDYVATPFEFVVNVTEAEPPAEGDNCDNPLVINLPADMPYADENQTTCGRGDDYNNTCLGYYDGGEDIIYQINVASAVDVDITLDPKGTTYTGMLVDASCPADPSSCIATSSNSGGSAHTISGLHLEAGTYYLMIDTWPSPDCIPDFNLTITASAGPEPGDDCNDPILVKLPTDLPYSDLSQTTCGRGDDYNNTCLGSYDGGEDIIYKLDVSSSVSVTITMDPKGTTWSGMLLDDACPADASDCIATVTGSSSDPRVIENIVLAPGIYYLMIDTWPSPNCIPDFDLTIEAGAAPPEITYDPSSINFGTASPGETGDTILTIGNTGEQDLVYSISISYGLKEIDGANITTPDSYTPGATADITFHLQNASSDAEWLDEATITFPAGVTVNTSTDFIVEDNTSHYLQYDGSTGDGITVTWFDYNGGYGNIYSTEMATAVMNLSFDGSLSGDLTLNYTISGDEYGSPPHDVSGSLTLPMSDPTTSWLSVTPTSGTVAGGSQEPVTVSFTTAGLPAGVYNAHIIISHNAGDDVDIPVTLTVGGGIYTILLDPDPLMVPYAYTLDPMEAKIYVGDDFEPGYSVNDINLSTVMINGTITPTSATIIPSYPDMTGPILKVTCSARDLILFYGFLYDTTIQTYSVSGEFNDSTPFTEEGECVYIGHRSGDLNMDGNVNVADLTYFVQFLFAGGPPPVVMELADVDASGGDPNVADLTYLVNYLFGNGNPPMHH